jgi:uncharacterized protein YjdB
VLAPHTNEGATTMMPRSSHPGSFLILAAVLAGAVAACSDATAGDAEDLRIQLENLQLSVREGEVVQVRVLALAGALPQGTSLSWSSSDNTIVSVDSEGRVRGMRPGTAGISVRAALRDLVSTASTQVTVVGVPSRVVISGHQEPLGFISSTRQLQAAVFSLSGAQMPADPVDWVSRDPSVAVVSPSGVVTALAVGSARIVARADAHADSVTVVVQPVATRLIMPTRSATLESLGSSTRFTVFAIDQGGHVVPGARPTWTSLNPGIVSVDSLGLVTAVGGGAGKIVASLGSLADTASVSVAQIPGSITLSRASLILTVGAETTITGEVADGNGHPMPGFPISWSSSATAVATVNGGTVMGLMSGTALVQARAGGVVAAVPVQVEPAPVLLPTIASIVVSPRNTILSSIGQQRQHSAAVLLTTGIPTTVPVTWRSLDEAVATVSSVGVVTAVRDGTARIVAETGIVADTATVLVQQQVAHVELLPVTTSLEIGKTTQLRIEFFDAQMNAVMSPPAVDRWSSSDLDVVTVGDDGTVFGVSLGETTITASSGEFTVQGIVYVVPPSAPPPPAPAALRVVISPRNSAIVGVGNTRQLDAIVRDATDVAVAGAISWTSLDAAVATVDAAGLVTAQGEGVARIMATSTGATADTAAVAVSLPAGPTPFVPTNMPSDFSLIAQTTFDGGAVSGFDLRAAVSLGIDATAPISCCAVAQKTFPVGMEGGGGIGVVRDIASRGATSVYAAVWMKVSDNFRNHSSGITKVFYVWSANRPKMILTAFGPNLQLRSLLRYSPTEPDAYRLPNRGTPEQALLVRGQWHFIEYLVESETAPGASNGSMRWWLDGVLVGEYAGLGTHFPGESLHWQIVEWNTIWGGVGDLVTAADGDMYWRISHMYVGGK